MINIVLNERDYAERMLEIRSLGQNPASTISKIAKYYHAEGYKRSEIERNLELFMVRCDPNINIVKWQGAIDYAVKSSSKYPLLDIDYIGITDSELKKIALLKKKMQAKLMFTLLCIAKYGNAVNPNNNNWVNYSDRDIFSMANIIITSHRQSLMMNDLMNAGYIKFSKVVDNVNTNVKIVDYDSPTVLKITDFRDLGNQYMRFLGDRYFECKCCGRVVKQKNNAQKYCASCASEMNNKKTLENYYSKLSS